MCLNRILSLWFVIEVTLVLMCERTSMCPFYESTVLTYCKYHTERTWKCIAGKAFRFVVEPVCHTNAHSHTPDQRARKRERAREWKGDHCTKYEREVDRNRFSSLWILNMHNTNTHTYTGTNRNERERENGSWNPWRLRRWKGKWKCSQNTLTVLMKWHIYIYAPIQSCTHTRRVCISGQECSSNSGSLVAHKSQCKHTMNITIFSTLPIVSLRTVRRLWCYTRLFKYWFTFNARTQPSSWRSFPFYRSVWFQL